MAFHFFPISVASNHVIDSYSYLRRRQLREVGFSCMVAEHGSSDPSDPCILLASQQWRHMRETAHAMEN